MSEQTKIAWCDSTANFWSGCTKVLDHNGKLTDSGCKECYAEELANRFPNTFGNWGKGMTRKLHESAFKLAVKLNRKPWVCDSCERGQDEGHPQWCGGTLHRRRIFSLSLGDWLDPEVPVEWLARMLDTVRQCLDVDWLLCTKRPELWRERLFKAMGWELAQPRPNGNKTGSPVMDEYHPLYHWLHNWVDEEEPPSNVVVLASVENQEQADKRIPELLRIPAARRGLSCEPLLGPVNLDGLLWKHAEGSQGKATIDWVIIGGESGNKARPCNVEWVRSLRDQSKAADVPCFVKQLGANVTVRRLGELRESHFHDKKGGDWNEWPSDLRVREFYK